MKQNKTKMLRRMIALMMCVITTFFLCSCGDKTISNEAISSRELSKNIEDTTPGLDSLGKVSFSTENVLNAKTEYSYTYVEYAMPDNYRIEKIVPGTGSNIYIIATACDAEGYFRTNEDGVIDMCVIGYDISDGGSAEFQYAPDYTDYDDYYINAAATAPDGSLWLLVVFHKFENDTVQQELSYIHLNAEGDVINTVSAPMNQLDTDGYIQVDNQGNLYFLSNSTGLIVCDENGGVLMKAEIESYTPMSKTADGSVCILVDTENGSGLCEIDLDSLKLGEITEIQGISNGYPTLCSGISAEGTVLASNATSIYEVNVKTGDAIELVNMEQYGVSNAGEISRLEDGTFVFLLNETKAFYVSGLQMTSTGAAVTKTVLSLATVYPESPIMELINDFNRSNENYYIEVFDFSEYMDSGSYSDLFRAWNEAFVSGDIPDMIDFFNLPWHIYADKGFLVDLNAYLDTEDILPWLWNAMEYDGANYTFPSCFAVETLYGKNSALNGLSSWTLEDFLDTYKNLPDNMDLFDNISRELFVFYIEQYMIDDFIDYENAECQFESDEFISLLEFSTTLSEYSEIAEDDYQEISTSLKVRRDQILLEPIVLTSIEQMHNLEEYTIGEEISWIGWPCTHASKIQALSDVAIMAASKHIDGAVEFMKYLMDSKCQNALADTYFPITTETFEETVKQAEEDRSTTNTEIATEKKVDGTVYQIVPLSEDKANSYIAWMSTISEQTYYQWDIANIIDEECEALFAGDKTSAETAALIQNRVSVYLSEQK